MKLSYANLKNKKGFPNIRPADCMRIAIKAQTDTKDA